MRSILVSPIFQKSTVLCFSVMLIVIVAKSMYGSVTSQQKYRIDTRELSIVVQPDWMPAEFADGLQLPSEILGEFRIFDPGLVSRIGAAYQGNPWVRRVRGIRREFPGKVRVALDIRRPVACVRIAQWYYMVDEEGIRLPGIFDGRPEVGGIPLPFIRGVLSHPGEAGTPWYDRGVVLGAYVAKRISDVPVLRDLGITTFDVRLVQATERRNNGSLSLLTEYHTEIIWDGFEGARSARDWCESRLEILSNHLVGDGLLRRHPGLRDILRIVVPRYGVPTIVKR